MTTGPATAGGGRPVLVLGYGEMGHAMEALLGARHELAIWEKFPRDGFQSAVLEDAAATAEFILFCLPVNPHREVAEQIAPLLRRDVICVSIAKGLDESGQSAAQVLSEVFREGQAYALMYGPMISEELRAGRFGFAEVGCSEIPTYDRVRGLFSGSRLRITHSTDVAGISWSVILKNVYAIAFGMADELRLGDNARGYLTVAALQELERIVRRMGGRPGSAYGLAGLGDLVTTATSEDSHHHALGRRLARASHSNITGEGVHTLAMVRKHELFDEADYPLFKLVHDSVDSPDDAARLLGSFLERDPA